ncbi:hypothetical protein BGZ61DRAFT_565756 [Ilyonectria robusta]|uniref:uncharacterized protein n=1 Tax=Ilyonectria robusta TaxID=1079257 RepID=UPI001E8D0D35|nr:uncharacterized protein BGZ61DRAFT_565756 [Ilyonectria robusta]KAH8733688.1 hypothetical protein BGZ61DRAFT_565756 [Ilyonectria robusta]
MDRFTGGQTWSINRYTTDAKAQITPRIREYLENIPDEDVDETTRRERAAELENWKGRLKSAENANYDVVFEWDWTEDTKGAVTPDEGACSLPIGSLTTMSTVVSSNPSALASSTSNVNVCHSNVDCTMDCEEGNVPTCYIISVFPGARTGICICLPLSEATVVPETTTTPPSTLITSVTSVTPNPPPPPITVVVEPDPTPTANCDFLVGGFYWYFVISNIRDWSQDGGKRLKNEEAGCGAMTGWHFTEATGTQDASASFNLPYIMKAGCVERAIVSAGGPQLECDGHVFAKSANLATEPQGEPKFRPASDEELHRT